MQIACPVIQPPTLLFPLRDLVVLSQSLETYASRLDLGLLIPRSEVSLAAFRDVASGYLSSARWFLKEADKRYGHLVSKTGRTGVPPEPVNSAEPAWFVDIASLGAASALFVHSQGPVLHFDVLRDDWMMAGYGNWRSAMHYLEVSPSYEASLSRALYVSRYIGRDSLNAVWLAQEIASLAVFYRSAPGFLDRFHFQAFDRDARCVAYRLWKVDERLPDDFEIPPETTKATFWLEPRPNPEGEAKRRRRNWRDLAADAKTPPPEAPLAKITLHFRPGSALARMLKAYHRPHPLEVPREEDISPEILSALRTFS
jgi:hypothetical protein